MNNDPAIIDVIGLALSARLYEKRNQDIKKINTEFLLILGTQNRV